MEVEQVAGCRLVEEQLGYKMVEEVGEKAVVHEQAAVAERVV